MFEVKAQLPQLSRAYIEPDLSRVKNPQRKRYCAPPIFSNHASIRYHHRTTMPDQHNPRRRSSSENHGILAHDSEATFDRTTLEDANGGQSGSYNYSEATFRNPHLNVGYVSPYPTYTLTGPGYPPYSQLSTQPQSFYDGRTQSTLVSD